MVGWGEYVVIACYVSPNIPLSAFEAYLEDLHDAMGRHEDRPYILAGDFNAKAAAWGLGSPMQGEPCSSSGYRKGACW